MKSKKNKRERSNNMKRKDLEGNNDLFTNINQNIDMDNVNNLEQRRTNRLAAIIGVLAIVGAFVGFCFKLLSSVINVWPSRGYAYIYLHVLMTVFITTLFIIIGCAVIYCICDVNRFDVKSNMYVMYDKISDNKYANFINYTKLSMVLLFEAVCSIIPISFFDVDTRISVILGIIIFMLIMFAFIVGYLKPQVQKKNLKVPEIIIFIAIYIFIGLMIYLFNLLPFLTTKGTLNIDFNKEGIINIDEKSYVDFPVSEVKLYNSDNELIWSKELKDDDYLKAKEIEYISTISNEENGKSSQGVILNSEIFYTNVKIDLIDIIKSEGSYHIEINSTLNGNRLQIINTIKYDREFSFAKNKFSKEY